MANPNIVNVTAIYGNSTYQALSTTGATTITALTPSTGHVYKLDSLVVANVTATAATITISLNSAVSGGGTAYRLAYQISVPANATLVVVDKNNYLYVGESQSVVATAGTGNALEIVATYEDIS